MQRFSRGLKAPQKESDEEALWNTLLTDLPAPEPLPAVALPPPPSSSSSPLTRGGSSEAFAARESIVRKTLFELYHKMITPLARELSKFGCALPKSFIFVLPRTLASLPLAFLCSEDLSSATTLFNPASFLVASHSFSFVPSIIAVGGHGLNISRRRSVLLYQLVLVSRICSTAVVVGNPSPMPAGCAPLPGAEIESRDSMQVLRDHGFSVRACLLFCLRHLRSHCVAQVEPFISTDAIKPNVLKSLNAVRIDQPE